MKTRPSKTAASLLAIFSLLVLLLAACNLPGQSTETGTLTTNSSGTTASGRFEEYSLPKPQSGLMRPAIDSKGRIWFGEMGHNYLTMFDPTTRQFQQLTPPAGHNGIMGVIIAPDDTVWFAEQYANYLGRYQPATGKFQRYPLPLLSITDPSSPGQKRSIPSSPNDLALDSHGNIWFTELNADSLGRLNPQSGQIQVYPLSPKRTVQTLNPYGIALASHNQVWFTESSNNRLGHLDPISGKINYFTAPVPNITLMEISRASNGLLWMTSFMGNLVLSFDPTTTHFTAYHAPASEGGSGGVYGLAISPGNQPWLALSTENALARLDPQTGHFTYYHIPTQGSIPLGIVENTHNQTFWFTESQANKLGMFKP